MSSDSHSVDTSEEASALKGFLAIVLVVVLAAVGLGLKFGLAGIGALAIAASGAMLALLVILTAG
jgi:hypothetical protein